MSSRSLNKVQLIGNLTRDPELRYTPQGTAVCSFGLATNRQWQTEAGERREETEFHRIVAWNKLAELCSQLLTKGRKIYVEGRLQTRTWTAQDGNQRTTTEIVIDDMILLDSRRMVEAGGEQVAAVSEAMPEAAAETAPSAEEIPASDTASPQQTASDDTKTKKKAAKSEDGEKTEEQKDVVNVDDIPF